MRFQAEAGFLQLPQAKDLEHYDMEPFLNSSLFRANGYRHQHGVITKFFGGEGEEL